MKILTIACGTGAALALAGCGSSNSGSRQEGQKIEQKVQAGWAQFKFLDEPTMASQLAAFIKGKPTLTQVGAIEAAFRYGKELDAQQRLSPGDENRLVRDMERLFPATKSILDKEVQLSAVVPAAPTDGIDVAAQTLAAICVPAAESNTTNPPGVKAKVDALIRAYRADPSASGDLNYMQVAEANLRSGCGTRYAGLIAAAIAQKQTNAGTGAAHSKTATTAPAQPTTQAATTSTPAANGSGGTQSFNGNGAKILGPITLATDSTVEWTNDGGYFSVIALGISSQAHSGTSFLAPGSYSNVQVNAIGNWTIKIVPK